MAKRELVFESEHLHAAVNPMKPQIHSSSCFDGLERELLVEMVRMWGSATSDAVLDAAMRYFQHPEIKGVVSYRLELNCAVCFGDPISSLEDRAELTRAFHRFADANRWRVVYLVASQEFAYWFMQNMSGSMIEFGSELVFSPPMDPRKSSGPHASLVRRKSKQAQKEGVTIHEYHPYDPVIESGIEDVKNLWLKARRGLQIHISNVHLFTDAMGKRWFYAKQGERVIGVIVLNQLQKQQQWHINHLMVVPDAPHGVSELLMASILQILESEGCVYATVGSTPLDRLGEIQGLTAFSSSVARFIFKLTNKMASLQGLSVFWKKFLPQRLPSYLLFSRRQIGLRELLSIRRSMNGSFKESRK